MRHTLCLLLVLYSGIQAKPMPSIQKIPIKWQLSNFMPGVSAWNTHKQVFWKGTLHLGEKTAYPKATFRYNKVVEISVGSLLNKTSSDLTIDHAFVTNAISASFTPKPYRVSTVLTPTLKTVSLAIDDSFGVGINNQSASENMTTLSVFGTYHVGQFNTKLLGHYWKYMPDKKTSSGQGYFAQVQTLIRLANKPHRISFGVRNYDWTNPLTDTTKNGPDETLYTFYSLLAEKQYVSGESIFYGYETSTTIEKTTVYAEAYNYPGWKLVLAKLTIEYPLDFNKGVLLQGYYSSGEDNVGLRATLIWKY